MRGLYCLYIKETSEKIISGHPASGSLSVSLPRESHEKAYLMSIIAGLKAGYKRYASLKYLLAESYFPDL